MSKGARIRFWIYLIFSAAGLITAWVFNGIAVMQGADYVAAWFMTPVDLVLSWDLGIVALALSVFMIAEARRIGMKRAWLYLVLSGFTAMAFTVPLYLAMRERHLGGSGSVNNSPGSSNRG